MGKPGTSGNRSTYASKGVSIAGYEVRVEGAAAPLKSLLFTLWGATGGAPRGPLRYHLERDGRLRVLRTPDRRLELRTGLGAVAIHQMLLDDVFSRIGDAFAVHGACVARQGVGALLSGPSGFGKSTLAIHLALRGFDFLSDDLVLIRRRSGAIEPVPRGVHLRPGSRALLHEDDAARARVSARKRGRGEWTVDAERWFGRPQPCRNIGLVLLLRPGSDLDGIRRMHGYRLTFADGAPGIRRELNALGVARVRRCSADGRQWSVEASHPARLLAWIDSRPVGLVGWAKTTSEPPRFDAPPKVARIGRFQAAIELAQEIVNRGRGSRLGAAYAGRESEIAVDLAVLLRGARCYGLVPGNLEATVALVDRLFAEAISPPPPGRAALR